MFYGVSSFAKKKNIFTKCYEFLQFGSIMLIIFRFMNGGMYYVAILCVSFYFCYIKFVRICILQLYEENKNYARRNHPHRNET